MDISKDNKQAANNIQTKYKKTRNNTHIKVAHFRHFCAICKNAHSLDICAKSSFISLL